MVSGWWLFSVKIVGVVVIVEGTDQAASQHWGVVAVVAVEARISERSSWIGERRCWISKGWGGGVSEGWVSGISKRWSGGVSKRRCISSGVGQSWVVCQRRVVGDWSSCQTWVAQWSVVHVWVRQWSWSVTGRRKSSNASENDLRRIESSSKLANTVDGTLTLTNFIILIDFWVFGFLVVASCWLSFKPELYQSHTPLHLFIVKSKNLAKSLMTTTRRIVTQSSARNSNVKPEIKRSVWFFMKSGEVMSKGFMDCFRRLNGFFWLSPLSPELDLFRDPKKFSTRNPKNDFSFAFALLWVNRERHPHVTKKACLE